MVTLQVNGEQPGDEDLGGRAAQAIFSLIGGDFPELDIVQTVDAIGDPLDIKSRSEIRLLKL